MVLALGLAWIVARTDTPGRRTIESFAALPFFIPPVLTATAWGMLAAPRGGLINLAWSGLTGSAEPLVNIYSYGGVVWHMMQYTTPFLFLLFATAFKSMDPSLEESSRMSGASSWTTFRRVTLSLMLPITTSAFILAFIRGVEAFESPMFFGTPARIHVLTTEIYNLINHDTEPNYQEATALALFVMGLLSLLIVWQWRLLGSRSFLTVTGRGYQPRVTALGRWRFVTLALALAFIGVTVVLPVGQLVLGSFFKFFGFYRRDMLTLQHYREVWESRLVFRAFANTLLLGFAGATATMLLGSVAAYVIVRTRLPMRRLVEVLAWLPWMMPGMVLGVGLLWAYALLPGPLALYGTRWALLIAYVTLSLPLAVRTMAGAFSHLGGSRGELAGPRRRLLDHVSENPALALLAVVRRRLDPSLLHHPARALGLDPALRSRQRSVVGGGDEALERGKGGRGERNRARLSSCSFASPFALVESRIVKRRMRWVRHVKSLAVFVLAGSLAQRARRSGRRSSRRPSAKGKVVLYSALVGAPSTARITEAFEAKYGIPVDTLEARASELLERVRTEQASGRALGDLSYNGSTATERQMLDSVFVPHGGLSSVSRLAAPFASDGTRVPAFVIHFGILVNTDLVKPADEPRSWTDLLLPRWKGQILADDVHPVGSGSLFFQATYGKLGRAFHEKLAAQDPSFTRDPRGSQRRVARGEYPIFLPSSLAAMQGARGASAQDRRPLGRGGLRRLPDGGIQERAAPERGATLHGFPPERRGAGDLRRGRLWAGRRGRPGNGPRHRRSSARPS